MNEHVGPLLSREQIVTLLQELGADLAARGVRAQLFVVGGAAMTLAFNTRRLTRDVDGVFEPKAVVYEAARRVAARHEGLPDDWLNDAVKGLLPGPDPEAKVVLNQPGVSVSVPSARYLLALKVQAARVDRDADDIRFLAGQCGAQSADEVLSIAESVIGTHRLQPKSQFIVEQMFSGEDRPSRWRRLGTRLSRTADSKRQPPGQPPKPPRCNGRTKAGKRCVLRAGHAGHHRGRW